MFRTHRSRYRMPGAEVHLLVLRGVARLDKRSPGLSFLFKFTQINNPYIIGGPAARARAVSLEARQVPTSLYMCDGHCASGAATVEIYVHWVRAGRTARTPKTIFGRQRV